MINNDRRNFLYKSTMLAASGVLTACGGGAGADPVPSNAQAGAASAAPADTVIAATVTISPTGTPLPNAVFRLSSATTARAPYCLGYAFRRGDVPSGSAVTGDTGTMQVVPKNRWPDGSLKFAVIAGLADIVGGADTPVGLLVVPATAVSVKPLSTAKLRATEIVAQVGCGAYGTVTWSGLDWDTPFQTWVSGSVMSSWIYRKPVGTDPHLVAWLEVRLWSSGAVEVLPWIENGYVRVAAPINKAATFTFTLGKTQRVSVAIDLKHHQRTPLINGTALSYWLASDPGVTPRHDNGYLQATELVPTYQAKVAPIAAALTTLASSYQPLQAGNFRYDGDAMPSSGYQDPIGLLPQHDVLYLTSDSLAAFGAVVRNGFSAGRYGIHYRDENTNRPLRFSSYPTLNIGGGQGFKDTGGSTTNSYTPTPGGGNAPQWDVAHSPSVGYLAYLITGRWYFMEEVQFATTANYLGNGDNAALRSGSKGLVQTCTQAWQTRSCAWDWRARVQALCVTPDDDVGLRAEFIASVEANIEHFHGRYIAKPNNPFGWVKPGEVYTGTTRVGAPWQQDFVTAAFGYSVSLGLPISTTAVTKLNEFFQWKARSVIGRLGPKGAFWYVNAVPYNAMISPSNAPDYDNGTGPWYPSEAACYEATYVSPPAWMGTVDGTLAGEIMPGERAMWGNLMPAIAYAVRHNVPGALEAYARVLRSTNWPKLRDAFNARPVWAVAPAGFAASMLPIIGAPIQADPIQTSAPAWLAGKPVNEWLEIPGTTGADGTSIDAYSGFALKQSTGEILIALAGGHNNSGDTRVSSISLLADAPSWKAPRRKDSVALIDTNYSVAPNIYPYCKDGVTPSSRHTRYQSLYCPQNDRIMLISTPSLYGAGGESSVQSNGFSLATNAWDAPGTWANVKNSSCYGTAIDDQGNIWCRMQKWLRATNTMVDLPTAATYSNASAFDPVRRQLFTLAYGNGEGYTAYGQVGMQFNIKTISEDLSSVRTITFQPSREWSEFQALNMAYCAMTYDKDKDVFYYYYAGNAGVVYVITPNAGTVWTMSKIVQGAGSVTGATIGTGPSDGSGIQNRFQYVEALKGIVMLVRSTSNLYFMRTS